MRPSQEDRQIAELILDCAPEPHDRPCWTGWYAWKTDHEWEIERVRRVLGRLARHGVMAKLRDQPEYAHGTCYWRLALPRDEAIDRYDRITAPRRRAA